MRDIATLADAAIHHPQAAPGAEPLQVSPVIRKLFMLLHGSYGNLFISKFSTGEKDGQGRDKGIRAAMKIWEARLSRFPGDVVETAAERLSAEHPDFPPNLPQFEKVCQAAAPRKTHAELEGLPLLSAPVRKPVFVQVDRVGDGLDWARIIEARAQAGDTTLSLASLRDARAVLDKLAKMNAPAASEGELLQEGGAA